MPRLHRSSRPAGAWLKRTLALGAVLGFTACNAGGIGIGAASGGGAGRATVERDGPGATIRIEGTTPYGAPVSAVIRCHDVG